MKRNGSIVKQLSKMVLMSVFWKSSIFYTNPGAVVLNACFGPCLFPVLYVIPQINTAAVPAVELGDSGLLICQYSFFLVT